MVVVHIISIAVDRMNKGEPYQDINSAIHGVMMLHGEGKEQQPPEGLFHGPGLPGKEQPWPGPDGDQAEDHGVHEVTE